MGKQEFKNRWMPWKDKLGMGAWSLKIAKIEKNQTNKQTNKCIKRTQKGSKERVLALSWL